MHTMPTKRANHALISDEDVRAVGIHLKHNLGISRASLNPCPFCASDMRRRENWKQRKDSKNWKRRRRSQYRCD